MYRDNGFLPEGLLNYLALLGWAIAADRDVFTIDEMVEAFDIRDVNPNPARFDLKKAEAINADHMRMLSIEELTHRVLPFLQAAGVVDRPGRRRGRSAARAGDAAGRRADEQAHRGGRRCSASCSPTTRRAGRRARRRRPGRRTRGAGSALGRWRPGRRPTIEAALREALVEKLELKPRVAFGPVRIAVTGRKVSPPLFESLELLGRSARWRRLAAAWPDGHPDGARRVPPHPAASASGARGRGGGRSPGCSSAGR